MDEINDTISKLYQAVELALAVARRNKPNDRSELDRRYAIAITDLEKIHAYVLQYIYTDGPVDEGEVRYENV